MPPVDPAPSPVSKSERLDVLVAEDNVLNRKVMTAFLSHLGHNSTEAEDGDAAYHAVVAGNFDVVLLDIQLPGLSGIEVVEALRRLRRPLPFLVAATAMARSDGERYYSQLGFDAYIGKPVTLADLEGVLAKGALHSPG